MLVSGRGNFEGMILPFWWASSWSHDPSESLFTNHGRDLQWCFDLLLMGKKILAVLFWDVTIGTYVVFQGSSEKKHVGGLLFHWSHRLFVIVTSVKDGIHAVYQTEAKMSVEPFLIWASKRWICEKCKCKVEISRRSDPSAWQQTIHVPGLGHSLAALWMFPTAEAGKISINFRLPQNRYMQEFLSCFSLSLTVTIDGRPGTFFTCSWNTGWFLGDTPSKNQHDNGKNN